MKGTRSHGASPVALWAAMGAVYFAWGGTYLGIRLAIDTIPPLLMASTRYLVAGALLYAWAIRRGDRQGDRPTARQWRSAAIIGGALLLGGNGLVTLSEQHIPSGITALLLATVPLWMVLLTGVLFGERVRWLEWSGILIGFAGVAFLAWPSDVQRLDPLGMGMVIVASISWASGSIYARRANLPGRPLVGVAMQMLVGGLALGVVGILRGELPRVHLDQISLQSALGLAYLIVVGSWVAFSAYVWLLRVARTSLVATYAYVNPIVAVGLGWLFLSEPVTLRTLIAGGVILAGVALIVTATSARADRDEPRRERRDRARVEDARVWARA
jgi:drug/metabolite transporter (DMT)-like permease